MNLLIQQVVIIGSVWPEPRSSAAGANMLSLIQLFLQQGWLVTFASPAQPGEQRADLSSLGVHEQPIALNCSSFDEWIVTVQPDMVLFDRFMMEEQFGWRVEQQCPEALRVLDTEDLHCLRDARQKLLKDALNKTDISQNQTLPQHSMTEIAACLVESDLAQREVAAIYRCDLSLLLSDVEIVLLHKHLGVPETLMHHVPFLLNATAIETLPMFSARKDFICIGNFLHAPNWDAVLWLKEQIWPLIRARLPNANVHIYGAYTPQKARDLHQPNKGFHIMGWVEDAQVVMKQARVCMAPLRFGAGIKGKLTEAMVCGTPSVTTAIGAEGMQGNLPWSGIVANDVEGLAAAAVRLYEDETLWQAAQYNGQTILMQRYNAVAIGSELIAHLLECKATLEVRRRANFTGALLHHHQHKSTKYMARWIEEKNRCRTLQSESLL